MEKEELLELIKGMREDDRKRLADSSIPAAGEERFVPVRNGRARILYYPAEAERRFLSIYMAEVLWQGFRKEMICSVKG